VSTLFSHARKVDAAGVVDDFWMLVDGDSIVATGTGVGVSATETVDVHGRWLGPGFLDLHCHGGGGYGFENGADAILAGLEIHRAHGTTRSLISHVANPIDALEAQLAIVATLAGSDSLILGSHLEGPFLAPERSGAHNKAFLHDPQPAEIDRLLDAASGTLRMMTIAPELPNALEAIEILVENEVTVAVGHTEADYEATRRAFHAGARILTHVFNAMPGIHHRAPGPIVAAFDDDRVTIELVLDGAHVHPSVAALTFASAPGRVALITDAMAAAGSTDGDYTLGSLTVTVSDGLAMLRGTSTLAGSTLTQDVALRQAITEVGVAPVDAIAAVTLTPARALGLERRHGLLATGFVADAVIMSPEWMVDEVWANGTRLYD
jgi:N-acetylglucosamine-6-phosphate deacetylase